MTEDNLTHVSTQTIVRRNRAYLVVRSSEEITGEPSQAYAIPVALEDPYDVTEVALLCVLPPTPKGTKHTPPPNPRVIASPCEGARHGFADAPRRPCYRATRRR